MSHIWFILKKTISIIVCAQLFFFWAECAQLNRTQCSTAFIFSNDNRPHTKSHTKTCSVQSPTYLGPMFQRVHLLETSPECHKKQFDLLEVKFSKLSELGPPSWAWLLPLYGHLYFGLFGCLLYAFSFGNFQNPDHTSLGVWYFNLHKPFRCKCLHLLHSIGKPLQYTHA